jgi:hypothetical protein
MIAMRYKKLFTSLLPAVAVVVLSSIAFAQDDDKEKIGTNYKLLTTIATPSGLAGGFDISWVDLATERYYLADRGNPTGTPVVPPGIDVIDLRHDKFLYSIPLPVAGNGVVEIRTSNRDDDDEVGGRAELWVGSNDSAVRVIELDHPFSTPFTISTGGKMRADELAYDPLDRIILIANDRDPIPFMTFISAQTRNVLGTLAYPQVVFGGSGHGLEQTVWDGVTRRFYLSVPATVSNPHGEVDEINPLTMKVMRIFPTTCGPAGLALIPRQRLMTSCGDVIGIHQGSVLTTVPGVAADEIWFNPGDERVYFATGIIMSAVDAESYTVIANVTVGQLFTPPPTPPPPNQTTHSVAADSENNHIAIPVGHVGVKVYTDQVESEEEDH